VGIGVWGLGIGDWGLGPIPNPQSPIPNPQSPIPIFKKTDIKKIKFNLFRKFKIMDISKGLIAIIVIPLVVTLMGFYKFLYFITIGYGLSISFVGLSLIIIYYDIINYITLTLGILFIVYGIRLSGYLIYRTLTFKNYNELVKTDVKRVSTYPIYLNIIIWIFCALLYTSLSTPLYYYFSNHGTTNLFSLFSTLFAIFGFILEILADYQKTESKKIYPKRFVDTGLYRIVRCPNYLGEIIMWTGVFLSSWHNYKSWTQFSIALIGTITLIFIMFGGARRLEIRQDQNYGKSKDYISYKSKVPIIIPFIPLYSVSKYKWLVG